jgi:putative PIN family toxin of toxin-antitoxin system
MRIVVDTNTAISGLLWDGPPHQLLELGFREILTVCSSVALIAELAEVLSRPKFLQRIRAASLSGSELIQNYARIVEIVDAQPLAARISRDPDDDIVIAAAVAARADLIVSGDRDLLGLRSAAGIPVVTATEALKATR